MECPIYGRVKEKEVIAEEVLGFRKKCSPGGDAGRPDHREAVIAFGGSIEIETRTEHINFSTVPDINDDHLGQDPFTLERF